MAGRVRYADWSNYPKRRRRDGTWLCRWCLKPLSGRRTSYCGRDCREQVEIRCGYRVRRKVWQRDRGVCTKCGKDTNARRRQINRARQGDPAAYRRMLEALELTPVEARKTLWEAHHKHPVSRGGGACGLKGFATLCVWCHKKVSSRLRVDTVSTGKARKK